MKADLNGVRDSIKSRPLLGRIAVLLWVCALPIMVPSLVIYYGAKEVLPSCASSVPKALGVVFLPWGK